MKKEVIVIIPGTNSWYGALRKYAHEDMRMLTKIHNEEVGRIKKHGKVVTVPSHWLNNGTYDDSAEKEYDLYSEHNGHKKEWLGHFFNFKEAEKALYRAQKRAQFKRQKLSFYLSEFKRPF